MIMGPVYGGGIFGSVLESPQPRNRRKQFTSHAETINCENFWHLSVKYCWTGINFSSLSQFYFETELFTSSDFIFFRSSFNRGLAIFHSNRIIDFRHTKYLFTKKLILFDIILK